MTKDREYNGKRGKGKPFRSHLGKQGQYSLKSSGQFSSAVVGSEVHDFSPGFSLLLFTFIRTLFNPPSLPPSLHHWLLSLNEPLVPIDELACSDVYLLLVKFVYTHFAG